MQRQEKRMAIKVLAIMRRSCGTAAMTKAEPPKRIRKSLASKVRASPYAGGVIPPLAHAEQRRGMHPFDRRLTTVDAAAFLGVSIRRLELWRQQGDGPPFLAGRNKKGIRYPLRGLFAFKKTYQKWSKSKGK